jgi:nucleotide-binding universal stress UspA family protein
MSGTKSIVVAIDDSPMSRNAVQWTLRNLPTGNQPIDLILLFIQPFWTKENIVHVSDMNEVHEDSKQIVNAHREVVQREIDDRGLKNVVVKPVILNQKDSVEFSTGACICDYVDELMDNSEVNLVLGSKEKGFFAKAFLGSVSEYCVKHVICPVTVVKLTKSKNN